MNKRNAFTIGLLFAATLTAGISLPAQADLQTELSAFKSAGAERGLAKSEIDLVCMQVERLVQTSEHSPLTTEQRAGLAEQVLAHCSNPNTVKAGQHNTQLIASMEAKLYEKSPSIVACALADVAANASLTTATGKVVVLDTGSLQPETDTSLSGGRTLASQLFQVAIANVHWQNQRKDHTGRLIKKGRIQFTQTNEKCSDLDTGERLTVAYEDGTVETLIDQGTMEPLTDPAISNAQLKNVYVSLTGRADFEALGELTASQNPSRFITLGEDTTIHRGSGGNGFSIGSGWMVAATKGCHNGMCATGPQKMATVHNPLQPVSDVTIGTDN